MKVIYGLRNFERPKFGAVVAMGVFDGVHIGHKKVIESAVRMAGKRKMTSVVLTFDPHPTKILQPELHAQSLISLEHRIRLIEKLGADMLVVLDFSRALAKTSANDFAKNFLARCFRAREVFVGDNFYFGRRAGAGAYRLKQLGGSYGFHVNILRSVKAGGKVVSSSLIRKMIASGNLKKAAGLLGRSVSVLGTVVGGAQLARELGYPTANLNPHHEVIPPSGVYAVFVNFHGKTYDGVLNIGLRPTFYAPRDREPAIEVHIFGFRKNLYGRDLEVSFVRKIRDEILFSNKSDLIARISEDEKKAKKILKKLKIRDSA